MQLLIRQNTTQVSAGFLNQALNLAGKFVPFETKLAKAREGMSKPDTATEFARAYLAGNADAVAIWDGKYDFIRSVQEEIEKQERGNNKREL